MFEEYKDKATKSITEINSLKPKLIEIFIKYYGPEHETHITQIINSVNFVFSYDGNYIISSKMDLESKDIKFINEKLNSNKSSLLGETFCYTKFHPPIINLGKEAYINGLDLHKLVHELNHMMHAIEVPNLAFADSLMSQFMPGFQNSNVNKIQIGITDDNANDIFYEIINEYMTREILKDTGIVVTDNHYMILDRLLDNKIYEIFKSYEEKIKEILISHKPYKFFDIMNKEAYLSIRSTLEKLFVGYCDFNVHYIFGLNESQEYDVNLEINEFKKKYKGFLNNLINYIDTNVNKDFGTNSHKL